MANEKKHQLIDPSTGEVRDSGQYEGNADLDKKARENGDTKGGDDLDKKYSPDQEELKTEVDEADYLSNVGVEARRTREEFSENPSKDNK